MEEFLTVQQAADRKGVKLPTIYKAIREGRLASHKVLGRVGLRPSDVDAYEPGSYGEAKRSHIKRGPVKKEMVAAE